MEEHKAFKEGWLDQFTGESGYVVDENFDVLTNFLEVAAKVVEEEEFEGNLVGAVMTLYEDGYGQKYRLVYNVRNPRSPEGIAYAYMFDRA